MSFDVAARSYDRDFTDTTIGQWLRQQTQTRLAVHTRPGDFVIEIGCGTGEDACWLAKRGIRVLATDASPVMLETTAAKAQSLGLGDAVTCELLDLNRLPEREPLHTDAIFSNFGPLNCTNDFETVGTWFATHLKHGSTLMLGVMSPFCLWETLWHGIHLDFKTASRRWNGHTIATLPDGSRFPIYYPSVRRLKRAFAAHFTMIDVRGVGVWLPPSDSAVVIENRPRLARWLHIIEKHSAHRWPMHLIADHYWVEFQRKPA